MKSIIKLLRKIRLKTRIFLFLVVFVVLPSTLIFYISSKSVNDIYQQNTEDYIESTQKSIESNLDMLVNKSSMFYLKLVTNLDIYKYATNYSLSFNERQDAIYEIVKKLSAEGEEKYFGHLVTNSGEVFNLKPTTISFNFKNEYISKIKASTSFVWDGFVKDESNNTFYPMGRRFYNYETGYNLGAVVLYVDEKDIYNIYKNMVAEDGAICIVNKNDGVISTNRKEFLGYKLLDLNFFINDTNKLKYLQLDNKKYIVSKSIITPYNSNMPNNWFSISFLPQDMYYDTLGNFAKSMNIVELLLVFISLIVSIYLSGKFIKRLAQLESNLQRFGYGDLNVNMPIANESDEIGSLQNMYSVMVIQIKELIYKNNKEKEKQRKTELIALQAQINPHFIYNTLDTISWMAKMKNQDDIEKIVYALSSFFKISLHNGDKFITVEEEIAHVKSYIAIEEIRFPGAIDFNFEIDENILQYEMMKILLQPFVENAIKHGFKKPKTKGTINIKGYEDAEYLIFEVIDDGNGFDMQILTDETKKMFGINNTTERIILEYGYDCGVKFFSKDGIGTRVVIKVKILE